MPYFLASRSILAKAVEKVVSIVCTSDEWKFITNPGDVPNGDRFCVCGRAKEVSVAEIEELLNRDIELFTVEKKIFDVLLLLQPTRTIFSPAESVSLSHVISAIHGQAPENASELRKLVKVLAPMVVFGYLSRETVSELGSYVNGKRWDRKIAIQYLRRIESELRARKKIYDNKSVECPVS